MQNHFSYFPRMRSAILLVFVLVFFGCPPADTPPEDEWLNSVHFDFLQSTNQLYFDVQITSEFQGSSFEQINILWYGIYKDSIPDIIALNDDGEEGDILPGDGHYSRKITNSDAVLSQSIPASATGTVYLDIKTVYGGNEVVVSDSFQLGNIRPSILNVSFPDTLLRPTQPSTYAVDTIQVVTYDPNGLNDIQSCYLLFEKPDSTWANNGDPILLYDDGVQNQQAFLWDNHGSDGVFSRLITIGHDNPLGTYTAHFHIKDIAGDYGEIVIKTLEVIE